MLAFLTTSMSIVIANFRSTPWYFNVCWQVCVFLLVFIPFAVQSKYLTMITLLDSGEFADKCNSTWSMNFDKDTVATHIDFKWGEGVDYATERMLLDWAKKFDTSSESLADKIMCSSQCPCHSIRNVSADGTRNDVAWQWMQLDERMLNMYGRTKDPAKASDKLVPLVFRADKN